MKARRQKQHKVLSKRNDTDVRHVSVTAYVLYACCEEFRVCACPIQTGKGGGRGKGGWERTSDDVYSDGRKPTGAVPDVSGLSFTATGRIYIKCRRRSQGQKLFFVNLKKANLKRKTQNDKARSKEERTNLYSLKTFYSLWGFFFFL